jgi:hypothetical protein
MEIMGSLFMEVETYKQILPNMAHDRKHLQERFSVKGLN